MTRIIVAVALGLAAASSVPAQRDFLTNDEIEKVREAQDPNQRLQVYILFARQRLDQLQQQIAKDKKGRSLEVRQLLDEYTQIIDAIDTVSDDALKRKVDIQLGANAVAEAEQKFSAQLKKIEASQPHDLDMYEVALKNAIGDTDDSIATAHEDLGKRGQIVAAKAEKEKKEIESLTSKDELKQQKAEDAKTEAKSDDGQPKRKPPTLYRPGEKPPTPAPNLTMPDFAFAVRALSSRNYRLFFSGQSVSLIGTWMTRLATSWLVYRLTGSAVLLGLSAFAGQIPSFLLAPIAGVLVDRWDRHRTLVWTQVLSMIQSFLLAGLALTHTITIWEIIALAAMQGFINAFDMPARQAFLVRMVDRRDELPNAIALNSSMVNGARLIGPALAGLVIAGTGEGYCFLIDGISYIAVIVSLLMMHVAPEAVREGKQRTLHELAEGWRYVTRSTAIRSILVNLAIISIFGMPYTTLMPIFANQVLRGGPHTLGFLMAATGVGALAGALMLAARKSVLGLGRQIVINTFLFGASLIGFAFSKSLLLSVVCLTVAGLGMMQQMAAGNTILQTVVEDDKRGRVMAFYSMALLGMAPFGSLIGGSAAARIGAPWTVAWSGVACLLGGALFAFRLPRIRESVRPIYIRLGILPEVPEPLLQ